MHLFDKIELYLNYEDDYSVNKAFKTLCGELDMSIAMKNIPYSIEISNAAKKIQDKLFNINNVDIFSSIYNTSPTLKKARQFVLYINNRIKSELGVHCHEN